jgi:hypothetical protein
MLHVGDYAGKNRAQCVVDGREYFRARQDASGAALSDKNAIGRQLWRHHIPVKILSVQLHERKLWLSTMCLSEAAPAKTYNPQCITLKNA